MERAAHTLVNDGAFDENDDEDEDGYKSDDEKDPKATNNDNDEDDEDDDTSTNSNMFTAGGLVSNSKSSSNIKSKYTPHSLPHPLHKTNKQPPLHNKQKNLKQNETKTNALLNQSIFKHRRVLSASNLLALDSSDNDNNNDNTNNVSISNFITDSNNNRLLLRSSSSSLRSLSAFKNRQSYIDNRMSRHKKFKKHRRSMSTSMIGMIGDVITEEDVVIGKDLNFVNHKNHRRSVSTSIISAVTDDGDAEKEDFDLDFDDLVEQQQQQQKLGIIDGGSVLTEVNRLEEVRRLEEVKCKAQSPSSSQQQDSKPTTTTLQQDYKPSTIEFDFTAVGGVDTLWMAHHAGLAVTKKASRGSILRATSFSKSRLGLAGSSFLNIPSNGNSNRSGGNGGPMMRASSIGSTNSNIGTAGTSSHNQSILPTTTTMGSLLNMMESRSPLPTLPSRDYIFRNDSKTASSRNISSADYSNYNDAFVLGDSITTDDNDKSAAVLSSSSLSSTAKFMKEMTEEFNFNGSWISDDKSLTSTYIPEIRMANHIRSISDACKCFLLINFFSFFQYIFLLLIDTIFSYNSKIVFHK